jgi:hypothetical protein
MSCDTTCAICTHTYSIPIRMPCGHLMCKSCWIRATAEKHTCPFCRHPDAHRGVVDQDLYNRVQLLPRPRACTALVSNTEFYTHMRYCEPCYTTHNQRCRRVIKKTNIVLEQSVGMRHSLHQYHSENKKLMKELNRLQNENNELRSNLRDSEMRRLMALNK